MHTMAQRWPEKDLLRRAALCPQQCPHNIVTLFERKRRYYSVNVYTKGVPLFEQAVPTFKRWHCHCLNATGIICIRFSHSTLPFKWNNQINCGTFERKRNKSNELNWIGYCKWKTYWCIHMWELKPRKKCYFSQNYYSKVLDF